jgi:hypothetical protein
MLHGYFDALRRTGRTTLLVRIVEDGDIIITDTNRNKELLDRALIGKKSVRVIAVNPKRPTDVLEKLNGTSCKNLYFDHTWLEKSYIYGVQERAKMHDDIKCLFERKNHSSLMGERHEYFC